MKHYGAADYWYTNHPPPNDGPNYHCWPLLYRIVWWIQRRRATVADK